MAKRLLWVSLVALIVLLDLWSKSAVFAWLPQAEELTRDMHGHLRLPLAGEWLTFMLSYNPGAAFGRFGDYPHLLIGGRCIAVVVLFWLLVRPNQASTGPWVRAALICVLAGAFGNLMDNLLFGGVQEGHPYFTVRDFVDVYFGIWDWHFPTFNVADSCITVGAILWITSGFLEHKEATQESPAGAPADDGSSE